MNVMEVVIILCISVRCAIFEKILLVESKLHTWSALKKGPPMRPCSLGFILETYLQENLHVFLINYFFCVLLVWFCWSCLYFVLFIIILQSHSNQMLAMRRQQGLPMFHNVLHILFFFCKNSSLTIERNSNTQLLQVSHHWFSVQICVLL